MAAAGPRGRGVLPGRAARLAADVDALLSAAAPELGAVRAAAGPCRPARRLPLLRTGGRGGVRPRPALVAGPGGPARAGPLRPAQRLRGAAHCRVVDATRCHAGGRGRAGPRHGRPGRSRIRPAARGRALPGGAAAVPAAIPRPGATRAARRHRGDPGRCGGPAGRGRRPGHPGRRQHGSEPPPPRRGGPPPGPAHDRRRAGARRRPASDRARPAALTRCSGCWSGPAERAVPRRCCPTAPRPTRPATRAARSATRPWPSPDLRRIAPPGPPQWRDDRHQEGICGQRPVGGSPARWRW